MTVRYLSVCAGIEAATVAWHRLGWKPVAYSEVEPFPCAVLANHYPSVPNWGDMTKFKEWPDAAVDLLVGGTPCQSFSVAGLRKGLDDPRGNLMLTYLAIAARYRPTWLVWENVPGVLSSNGGRDFASLLRGLGELGYGWAYRVLDAQYFGVAQRRRRVFVVGHIGDWHRAAAVLFERNSLSGNPAPSRKAREGTAKCLTAGVGKRFDPMTETLPVVAETLMASDYKGPGHIREDATSDTFSATDLEVSNAVTELRPSVQSHHAQTFVTGFHNRQDPDVSGDVWHPLGAQDNGMGVAVPFRDPCPTLTSKMQGSSGWAPQNEDAHLVGVPATTAGGDIARTLNARHDSSPCADRGMDVIAAAMQVRRLTPTECERLQGFPDGYTAIPWKKKPAEECPDGPRYKALGNSMAVPVMRWIGERIAKVQEIKSEKAAA